ncbi:MAG: hypothetical protein R3E84_10165 [Pseudomonadales bacterium]
MGQPPWFSNNRDYSALSNLQETERESFATVFDAWLSEVDGEPVRPSALVSPAFISRKLGRRSSGRRGRETLFGWCCSNAQERKASDIGPFFDEDWIAQYDIMDRTRGPACALTRFRTVDNKDRAPHPVLQAWKAGRDYYRRCASTRWHIRTAKHSRLSQCAPTLDEAA